MFVSVGGFPQWHADRLHPLFRCLQSSLDKKGLCTWPSRKLRVHATATRNGRLLKKEEEGGSQGPPKKRKKEKNKSVLAMPMSRIRRLLAHVTKSRVKSMDLRSVPQKTEKHSGVPVAQ